MTRTGRSRGIVIRAGYGEGRSGVTMKCHATHSPGGAGCAAEVANATGSGRVNGSEATDAGGGGGSGAPTVPEGVAGTSVTAPSVTAPSVTAPSISAPLVTAPAAGNRRRKARTV